MTPSFPLRVIAVALLLAVSHAGSSAAATGGPKTTTAPLPHPPLAVSPGWAPYAGRQNHAHAAPAFHWGWFGAERFAPPAKWHRGYYGDHLRWSRGVRF